MRNAYIGLVALSLSACASSGISPSPQHQQSWTEYRVAVLEQRDNGALTTLQAQEKIATRYREMYGPDPSMEGAFAYGTTLYRFADAGALPVAEADALVLAHEDEIFARRKAREDFHEWMESRFPPEPSD
jgi:hypothetical protein